MTTRTTKYTTAIVETLQKLGHATNAEMLDKLHETYPDVSATTVHRATARLSALGTIAEAPADAFGAMRYDANTTPHDHFICTGCGRMRDIDVAEKLVPTISDALGGCKITGRLTMNGLCESCHVTIK